MKKKKKKNFSRYDKCYNLKCKAQIYFVEINFANCVSYIYDSVSSKKIKAKKEKRKRKKNEKMGKERERERERSNICIIIIIIIKCLLYMYTKAYKSNIYCLIYLKLIDL